MLPLADASSDDDAGSGRDAGPDRWSSVPLPDGMSTGRLDGNDTIDTYAITSGGQETLTIRIASPPAEDFRISLSGRQYGALPVSGVGTSTLHIAAAESTTIYISAYSWFVGGQGVYGITLERRATPIVDFAPVIANSAVSILAADPEGPYLVGEGGLARLVGDSVVRFRSDVYPWALAATAESATVADSRTMSVRVLRTEGSAPVTSGIRETLAFGPDDSLYTLEYSTLGSEPPATILARYSETGERHVVRSLDSAFSLTFSPEGALHVLGTGGTVDRLDLGSGTTHRLREKDFTSYVLDVEFDVQGRAYLLMTSHACGGTSCPIAGLVVRYEGDWSTPVPVARIPGYPRSFALTDSGAVATYQACCSANIALARAAFDVEAFYGFRPSFVPAPAPDAAINAVRIEEGPPLAHTPVGEIRDAANEPRVIVVEIANVGDVPLPAGLEARMYRLSEPGGPTVCGVASCIMTTLTGQNSPMWGRLDTPLAPGESAEIRIPWNGTFRTGEHGFRVMLDPANDILEEEELTNNVGEAWTTVRIEGMGTIT